MTEANDLAESIADRVKDYRSDEIRPIQPSDVMRWVAQFELDDPTEFLAEIDHIFSTTYISKDGTLEFLESLATYENLTGADPSSFWRKCSLLDIQARGNSQAELLALFDNVLIKNFGIDRSDCMGNSAFVYIDDGIFSGGHAISDLEKWISSFAAMDSRIVIVTIGSHSLGEYWVRKRLEELAASVGKNTKVEFLQALYFENRKGERDRSDVLWPTTIPDASIVSDYLALPHLYPFIARSSISSRQSAVFSSESARSLVEQQMTIAGCQIRKRHSDSGGDLREFWRPLGFSNFGLGFGSMFVTYRNCPNNCPLALWWGNRAPHSPIWYPLFERKTNNTNASQRTGLEKNEEVEEDSVGFDDQPF